jgi:hypothetical protein
MTGRSRLVALVGLGLAVVVLVGVMAQRNLQSGSDLVIEADGSATATLGLVGTREYRSVYVGSLCVSEPGQVTVTSIEPADPRGGLDVTDFSVVPRGDDMAILGAAGGRLRDEPSYHGTKTVTVPCSTSRGADLFLELYKPGDRDAETPEFIVHYDSDDDDRTARLRFGFGLCRQEQCDGV